MAIHFSRASQFEENRLRIEDFIFRSIIEIQNDVERAILTSSGWPLPYLL